MKRPLLIFVCASALFRCSHAPNAPVVEFHEPPKDDTPYVEVLEKFTNSKKSYRNFETNNNMNVTYLSKEFLIALKARNQKLYPAQKTLSIETPGVAFFVSIFTPHNRTSLNDSKQWSILLNPSDQKAVPNRISKLEDKSHWKAFFPYINSWTEEYLVVFPKPVDWNKEDDQHSLVLELSNKDAKSTLNF